MTTLGLMSGLSLCLIAATIAAQEPAWNAAAIKECDRACLVGILDGYMNAIFAFMKRIRPRRALILDEQKQTVGTFPLFVHDGTRRGAAPGDPPGMLQNLVTMETFSVRGGQIHHVEAAPFVTIPYGLGNGWTPGSGR
jgi:hypothetical protein